MLLKPNIYQLLLLYFVTIYDFYLRQLRQHIELNLSIYNIIIFSLIGILVYLMLNLLTSRLLDGLFLSKNLIIITLTFGIFAYLSRFGLDED